MSVVASVMSLVVIGSDRRIFVVLRRHRKFDVFSHPMKARCVSVVISACFMSILLLLLRCVERERALSAAA